ncbi:hybrid signal transduction histidine kinase B [Achaetomium macrosporum]|uniref:histidine kinase n=1 Tax=Achaetomium macrosporum TaxID=79813 RepID=A0AAN7CGG3_9PEZI|nr:hybrid signal transduction histidine kinase B [Achaetomium macrosporum]
MGRQFQLATARKEEVPSSERARQREIAAYFSAASFPPDLAVTFQPTPLLNTDPILNGLAQLGALRLGCNRAFVSLIDRPYQYVVCEITRSHSLVEIKSDPDGYIFAFMDETAEWVRTGPDVIANRTGHIINDFKAHPDYKDLPYVTGYPYFTSHLEVPLVSPLGYILGSYCVVDDKYNDFDNDESIGALSQIAAAIIRNRSEQIIQGLTKFIRDEPLIHLPQPSQHAVPPAGPKERDGESDSDDSSEHPSPQDIQPQSLAESAQYPMSLSSAPQQFNELGQNVIEQHLVAGTTQADVNATSTQPLSAPSDVLSEPRGFISSANIKTTFFRAAATIRRSMDMDGLMLLDAVPSFCVDRPDQPSHDSPREPSHKQSEGPFCAAIVKSAIGPGGEFVTHSTQTQLPELSLQRFIRAYPDGHIFTADELGPIDDSYGVGKLFQSKPEADQESSRLRSDIAALFRIVPAAKYVIFLPLRHFQRECWYAAALGWVEDPLRAFDVTDIGLVRAFGNSVMAEVSRLEALAASRAKSDFVSSLSHELRSPLHGIMATSELLRDELSDRSLLSTLDMLESCATALLDTFNNLLDHATATHAGRDRGPGRSLISDVKEVDLGALVEDVVETVRVGHLSGDVLYTQTSLKYRRNTNPHPLTAAGHSRLDRPLLITIYIAKHQWKLPVSVGAWKRIVMNIMGNALKYTSSGRIEVGLKVVKRTDKTGNASDYISFTVEDTGLGMSSDFLKSHLFTPFHQEDSHAPGLGLGLSIVQQLVSELGGTVTVKSSLGVGTLVEVLVPLGKDTSGSATVLTQPAAIPDDQHSSNDLGLAGRTVCFIGPDAYAAIIATDFQITDEVRNWSKTVERAIRLNAETSLGMQMIVGTRDCPIPEADIYILDSNLVNETAKQGHDTKLSTLQARVAPLVLLCSGSGTSSCLKRQITKDHRIHLHHPIGPKKLASVLRSALKAKVNGGTVQRRATEPANGAALTIHGGLPTIQDILSPPPLLTPGLEGPASSPRSKTLSLSEPSEETRQPPQTNAALQLQTQPTRRQHLILVDDNPINIKLLTQLVRKLNHTFATASDGREAVRQYKNSLEGGQGCRFDLVFMDINMPVMNGFEATREIRRLETDAQVSRCKVVALTGLSSEVSKSEASASGLDMFLTKPVKMSMLKTILEEKQKSDEGAGAEFSAVRTKRLLFML